MEKIVINLLKKTVLPQSVFILWLKLKNRAMKKTLIYTNAVLTIIAIALTAIVLQNLEIIPKANAASAFTSLPLNEKGEVPVRVMNSTSQVEVTNVVDVNIEKVDGSSVWGKIPVQIK